MRQHISTEAKQVALRMLQQCASPEVIHQYTAIAPRTLQRLEKRFCKTHAVIKKPITTGQRQALMCYDLNVSLEPSQITYMLMSCQVLGGLQ